MFFVRWKRERKKKKQTQVGMTTLLATYTTGAWITLPAQRQKNSRLIVKSTKIPQMPIIMYIRGTKVRKKRRQSDHWWCTLCTTQSKQKRDWECSLGPTSTLRPTTLCPLQTLHHFQTAERWVRGTIWMVVEAARDCHVHWYLSGRRAWAGGRDEQDPTTTSNLVAIFGYDDVSPTPHAHA